MNEKRINQQISTFKNILDSYDFEGPLARFLSNHFRRNRQMGSKDRKIASRLIYNYFRLGVGVSNLPVTTRLMLSEFLCTTSSDFVRLLEPTLIDYIDHPIEDKISRINEKYDFSIDQFFPLAEEISPLIDKKEFFLSHFFQRDLFIRIHAGDEKLVKHILSLNNIEYEVLGIRTLRLQNGSQLDRIKEIDGRYEVQDLSSQQVIDFFEPKNGEDWWDACAASGGKSLLLKELNPTIHLLVSDIRSSILRNLDERFDKAGIERYRKKIIDLTKDTSVIESEVFDGIIIDAPCSGSGTWGRSPEQMSSFNKEKLEYYVRLQRQIIDNIIKHIKVGKPLIYITCSVYKAENEEQVEYLKEKGFTIEKMQYLEGGSNGADTLFVARLLRLP